MECLLHVSAVDKGVLCVWPYYDSQHRRNLRCQVSWHCLLFLSSFGLSNLGEIWIRCSVKIRGTICSASATDHHHKRRWHDGSFLMDMPTIECQSICSVQYVC